MNASAHIPRAVIHTGVGYCLSVSGSYRNLQPDKQGSTLFLWFNQPPGPRPESTYMCFKKSVPSRDDYVDLKELNRLINAIDFADPLYYSIVEAVYPGAGKTRLLSSHNSNTDQPYVSIKEKLDVYAAKVPNVCISYRRIMRDKMDKPFSRYHTETVWKVHFDNNQTNIGS